MNRVSMEGGGGRGAAGDGSVGEVGLGWLKCGKNGPLGRQVLWICYMGGVIIIGVVSIHSANALIYSII